MCAQMEDIKNDGLIDMLDETNLKYVQLNQELKNVGHLLNIDENLIY